MPRIRCHYEDCIFLDAGFCSAEKIELDPESGCLTYQQAEEAELVIADWEEEEADAEVPDDEEDEVEWEEEEDEDDDEEDDEDEW
ncbi:MAG TPA: hypothetical protein VFL17_09445 [Anaerolineae bacterium]|nr:hypothetical protein [Anaerolineae bacterium]